MMQMRMQENLRTGRRRDKMIRNIIFDIGNVLTDYRWEGFLADKGFDAEMIQKIAKASGMGRV